MSVPLQPAWIEARHMLPDRSGHFLCWCDRTAHMWIGAYNDRGGHDTWGDPRPLGWAGLPPTHWAETPAPPITSKENAHAGH